MVLGLQAEEQRMLEGILEETGFSGQVVGYR